MEIKGILKICKGIFSSNKLTFEDEEVSPPVSLKRLTQDNHAGFTFIESDSQACFDSNKLAVNSSFFVQEGFVKQEGFIKRE